MSKFEPRPIPRAIPDGWDEQLVLRVAGLIVVRLSDDTNIGTVVLETRDVCRYVYRLLSAYEMLDLRHTPNELLARIATQEDELTAATFSMQQRIHCSSCGESFRSAGRYSGFSHCADHSYLTPVE